MTSRRPNVPTKPSQSDPTSKQMKAQPKAPSTKAKRGRNGVTVDRAPQVERDMARLILDHLSPHLTSDKEFSTIPEDADRRAEFEQAVDSLLMYLRQFAREGTFDLEVGNWDSLAISANDLTRKGLSRDKIVEKLRANERRILQSRGCTEQAVRKRTSAITLKVVSNIRGESRKRKLAEEDAVHDLVDSGMTAEQVATQLGVTVDTVQRTLNERGDRIAASRARGASNAGRRKSGDSATGNEPLACIAAALWPSTKAR